MVETRKEIIRRLTHRVFDQPIIQNQFRSTYVEAMVEPHLAEVGWQYVGNDWNGWDFERNHERLEIKQSAAIQTWSFGRGATTRPVFDIAPRTGYFTNDAANWICKPGRLAHIYIFAWHGVLPDAPLSDHDPFPTDHRDPEQWEFYVSLEHDLPKQKTISLSKLTARYLAQPISINALAEKLAIPIDTNS